MSHFSPSKNFFGEEREGERGKDLCSLVHFPTGYNNHVWARTKPEIRHSIPIPRVGGRDILGYLPLPSPAHSLEVGLEMKQMELS